MAMTDPISDMLTRIRNALTAKHATVDVPTSRAKAAIAEILKEEGYIEDFESVDRGGSRPVLRLRLRYTTDGQRVISGLVRVSRPGRRVYRGKDEIPKVRGGLGVTIVSTPQGIMSGARCKKAGVGGEIICQIW